MIADRDSNQLSEWTCSNTGYLVRMLKETTSVGFDLEQFKAKIVEQTNNHEGNNGRREKTR